MSDYQDGWEAEFHQLQVGDRVRAEQEHGGNHTTHTGLITQLTVQTEMVYVGSTMCPARKDRAFPYKFFLLDREALKGPAWRAEPLSLWAFPGMPDKPWIRARHDLAFISCSTGAMMVDANRTEQLVPYEAETTQQEELEQRVINAAISWYEGYTSGQDLRIRSMDLAVAVDNLRNYEKSRAADGTAGR